MPAPVLIIIGADKGGVGKTFSARALLAYPPLANRSPKIFDTEPKQDSLKRYYPAAELVDVTKVDDQMRVFDALPAAGATILDVRAGLLSHFLRQVRELGMLDDVGSGQLRLVVFHVLGPTTASLGEIADTAAQLTEGGDHILIKNYVNENSQFFEFDRATSDSYFARLDSKAIVTIGNLPGRAAEAVDVAAQPFPTFITDERHSTTLRRHVQFWLKTTHDEFTARGLDQLVAK